MRKTAPKAYEEVSIKADNQWSTAICKTSHRRLLSLRSTGTAAYYTIDSRLWQNIVDSQTPGLIFRWAWLSLQRFQGAYGAMVLKHERKLSPLVEFCENYSPRKLTDLRFAKFCTTLKTG